MAFANIGSAEGTFNATTGLTDTVSAVSVPSLGANRIGIVTVGYGTGGALSITGVTWNGVSMTEGVEVAPAGIGYGCAVYSLVGCAHNGSYNIVVTWASTTVRTAHVTVAWADATNTISADDTSSTTGTSQNPTITSTQATANELVVSVSSSSANTLGAPSVTDCTLLQDWDAGGDCFVAAYSTPASSGDATHQHNYGQSGTYAIASGSFQEETVAGGATWCGWVGAGWW